MSDYSDKKNSFWLSAQFMVVLASSFICLKINLTNYGEQSFGLWILFSSFWGLSSSLDLGFGTAIIKHLSGASNKENNELEISIIASTGMMIFVILGSIILIAGNLIAEVIIFNNSSIINNAHVENARVIFFLIGLSFLFRYVVVFINSIFEGRANFVSASILNIGYNVLLIIVTGLIFLFRYSITILSFSYLMLAMILFLVSALVLYKKYPEIKLGRSYFRMQYAKKMFGFSLSVQGSSLLGAAIDPSIKYILGNYDSLNTISYYEIARRFALAISGLFQTAFRTFLPKVSVLPDKEKYKSFIMNEGASLSKLGVAYTGIFFGILGVLFAGIIKIWFGYSETIVLFLILCLVESFNVVGFMSYVFLLGIGKALYIVIVQAINLIFAIIWIIVGYWLLGNYIGLLGYSGSIMLGNIILILFLKKESGISIREYLKNIRLFKLIFINMLLLTVIITNYYFKIDMFILLGLLSGISLILFADDLVKYYKFFLKETRAFFFKSN